MHQLGGSLKKRGAKNESPRYLIHQAESEANRDEMLADLVEIIIAGLSVVPIENVENPLPNEKTQGKRDSFPAGLPFANVPYSNSEDQ